MERLIIFIVAILVAAYGAGFTGFGCWRACVHNRRPSWYFVLLGTGVTALSVLLLFGRTDLFFPSRWDDYKGGFWPLVLFPTIAAAIIALVSSVAVVYYFRSKYRHVETKA
jgi:Na+-driven multidrug efflux pump